MTTLTRIYQSIPLKVNDVISLDENAVHHLGRVLRAKKHDNIILFNGEGGEYQATLIHIDKKNISAHITTFHDRQSESHLELYLAQGIQRGEKMDYTIQKAVELGVKKIYPLYTERSNVKLEGERAIKRLQHWEAIIINACEQSGRNKLPALLPPQSLTQFISTIDAEEKFVLTPYAKKKLTQFSFTKTARIILLVGPEGGLSEDEITLTVSQHFAPLNLGPRILRTETASIAALTALQFYAGDLG